MAPALLFPWNDTYSVGVGIIDTQYRVLVDLINELHQAMTNRIAKEHLGKVLSNLVNYPRAHLK